LTVLNVEITAAASEKRQYREAEEVWDAERRELESKMREQDTEVQRLRMQLTSVEASKQVSRFHWTFQMSDYGIEHVLIVLPY
jgi:hypothetical protein